MDGMDMELKCECLSSVKRKKVEWLWYPYIPYGKITLLQGDPGEGKSIFILNVAALLTRGVPILDGFPVAESQTVIYQCAEDHVADTAKPRLLAADAAFEKVAFIVDEAGRLTLEDDRIEKAIQQTKARLVILDPLQALLSQDGDMQSAVRMRNILGILSLIASIHLCSIDLIGHMNKGNGGNSIYCGLGSIDIAAIARSMLMIKRNCADSKMRYITPIKSSLSAEGCSIAFSLGGYNGIQWIGPCDYDDADSEPHPVLKNGKRYDVIDFFIEMLQDQDILGCDVLADMNRLVVSRRTVFHAKKDIGV